MKRESISKVTTTHFKGDMTDGIKLHGNPFNSSQDFHKCQMLMSWVHLKEKSRDLHCHKGTLSWFHKWTVPNAVLIQPIEAQIFHWICETFELLVAID